MLPKVDFSTTQAYQYLADHYIDIAPKHLKELFAADAERVDKFSISFGDILFDDSKNRIDDTTKALLVQLARECKLDEAIEAMFAGKAINATENRAVMHTALPANMASMASSSLRSEKHTSELQSRENIVCRLLPEN